jgi:colanic acid biosynthesis glycosyl transferase WcaI
MNDALNPSIFVLYHYLPPDDVVSAVHLGDLCAGLAKRGWQVSAFPTVWGCRNENIRFAHREEWQDVQIHRLWRPRFQQSSGLGRLLNAAWMIARWSLLACSGRERPDVLLVGTDPILSVLVARFWKVVSPRTEIVHWCFDLYPEAAIADGLLSADGLFAQFLGSLLRPAYRACSVIADIGPCMSHLLAKYASNARRVTCVPWALEEPNAPLDINRAEREEVFGTTSLALLYSGNFGRAHSYSEILQLIEKLTVCGARLAFSVRGNREAELRRAAAKRRLDVRFVPFAAEERLAARLACTDVHVVSLRSEWTGMVVPSKFFGALSVGRPVLFAGSPESAVGQWIRLFKVGWVLSEENIDEVAAALIQYSRSPEEQAAMRENCFRVYQQHFSKHIQIDKWHSLLRSLLTSRHSLESGRTNGSHGGSHEGMPNNRG